MDCNKQSGGLDLNWMNGDIYRLIFLDGKFFRILSNPGIETQKIAKYLDDLAI